MKDIINLRSRYNEVHKLIRIGDENSHLYQFKPSDDYYRVGYNDDSFNNYQFVDPSGGPFISVGMELPEVGKKVKAISRNEEGLTVEFEQ